MPKEHRVRPGECISSIAETNGFFPDTIWNHADNADLKKLRQDPNTLVPGDVVVIPDKEAGEESGATGARHKFKRKGVPETFVIRLLDPSGEPYASADYVFKLDGTIHKGKTDADGVLEMGIPPGARGGVITMVETGEEFEVALGSLHPIDTIQGIQQRLENMGLPCADPPGEWGESTAQSLRTYQELHGLEVTGDPDATTLQHLHETHGG